MIAFEAPADAPTVAVAAVGEAEGARGAAAALACAGADTDRAALLVELGGRPPRPTLLASAAARELEQRLRGHLPGARVAARGLTCHLGAAADREGLEAAAAAATVARGGLAVVSLPAVALRALLDQGAGPRLSGALLRADLGSDRALTALVGRELIARGLDLAVLKRRLSWTAERRALFGSLPPGPSGLPAHLLRKLLSHPCYSGSDGTPDNPTRVTQPERRDHAGTGSR